MYIENCVSNNVYTNNLECEYAYRTIPAQVSTIEELVNYNKYGIYPFLYLKDLINEGYNFMIGQEIENNHKTLYLLNYKKEENKIRS